jgi:hypothetical protein
MTSTVRKLRRLYPRDCWGLGVAYLYLLLAGCRIMLRREDLDRWLPGRPVDGGRDGSATGDVTAAVRRARWVNAAARYPLPWARCLQRSLALCIWLERLGYSPVLQIGVRLEGATLSAHAWVEHEGHVINDTPRALAEFAVLRGTDLESPGGSLSQGRRWI